MKIQSEATELKADSEANEYHMQTIESYYGKDIETTHQVL